MLLFHFFRLGTHHIRPNNETHFNTKIHPKNRKWNLLVEFPLHNKNEIIAIYMFIS